MKPMLSEADRLSLVIELSRSIEPIYIHPREPLVIWSYREIYVGVHYKQVQLLCMNQNWCPSNFFGWHWNYGSARLDSGDLDSSLAWSYPAAAVQALIAAQVGRPLPELLRRENLVVFVHAIADYALESYV